MRLLPLIAMVWMPLGITGASAAGTGTMYIMAGSVSGTGMISGTVSVGAGGSIAPGASTGTLQVDGSLNVSDLADGGTGKLSFELNARNSTNDKITTTGTLTIGVGKLGFSDFTFTNLGGLEVGTYTLITGSGINPGDSLDSGNLSGTLNGYTCTLAISGGNINLVVSEDYTNWAIRNGVTLPTGNPDGDTVTNLEEYAFGTNPTATNSSQVSYTPGGAVTAGLPKVGNLASGPGVDYRAIFCRRKDYIAAGLTYTVQFSANLSQWVDSNATPTLLSDPNSSGPVDAVSVPYPFFVSTPQGSKKPTFFRIAITKNP